MQQRLCRNCCDLACLEFQEAEEQGVGVCQGCGLDGWLGSFPIWSGSACLAVLGWVGYAVFFLLVWLVGRGQ